MDEIQKLKELLGSAAKGYSEAQLQQLRREMYAMAGFLVDIYLTGKQGHKGEWFWTQMDSTCRCRQKRRSVID